MDKNDFVHLQKSNEPWFCINCNDDIFPFNDDNPLTILPHMNKNITELKTFFDQLNIISEETLSSDDNSFSINCKYYDTDDFCAQFNKSKCFSAFHLNIASLTKHFDELQNLLCTLDTTFSIIAITETKFSRNILPLVNYSLPHYSIEHTPTDSSAGGAILYISNHLAYKPRNDLTKKLYINYQKFRTFLISDKSLSEIKNVRNFWCPKFKSVRNLSRPYFLAFFFVGIR